MSDKTREAIAARQERKAKAQEKVERKPKKAEPKVDLEVDNQRSAATTTIVENGAERDRLWDDHVRALPWFADYPAQTGRVIPMVRIRRSG